MGHLVERVRVGAVLEKGVLVERPALVGDLPAEHRRPGAGTEVGFLRSDYTGPLPLAAADPSLELVAAVHHRGDEYRLDDTALHSYLEPRNPASAGPDLIRSQGRGIRYTRTAFAYLFRPA